MSEKTKYGFDPLTGIPIARFKIHTLSVGIRPIGKRKRDSEEVFIKCVVKRFRGNAEDWQKINEAAREFCDRLNGCESEEDQRHAITIKTYTETVK